MKLILEKKPLQGTWWKYALALTLVQNLFWCVLGWVINPAFTLYLGYRYGWFVWGGWIIFSWLAFIVGRLGFKTVMWFGLAGFLVGDLAYATMAFYEPIRRLNDLLPYTGFVQANLAFLSLGILVEFGQYVYRRVFE